jgi:hypothetical protein
MVEEMERPDDVTATILEGLALEALSRLHRGNRRAASSSAPQWLCTIREYLHDRFRGPIRLDALALEVGIHADHVSRVFADRKAGSKRRSPRPAPSSSVRVVRWRIAAKSWCGRGQQRTSADSRSGGNALAKSCAAC